MLLALLFLPVCEIPTTYYPPKCSIDPRVLAQFPRSAVINITDAKGRARCISAVAPKAAGPAPILFYFHGAGGNAAHFGAKGDTSNVHLNDLVEKYAFGLVGGEAVQWSAPGPGPAPGPSPGPAPGPIPEDCLQCFADAGCKAGGATGTCLACMKREQGPCTHVCEPEHVPFPSVEKAICSPGPRDDEKTPHVYQWHGGEWLIPEVQNDTTGLVCDWESDSDLIYVDNAVKALAAFGGGKVFDPKRVFFTGCSMGSAMTGWVAQCYHEKYAAETTAFCTQSTGLKVKGDGLHFPPDNYADGAYEWGECPTCKYFPAPVTKTPGLKACFVDQTSDPTAAVPYFYKSTLAMQKAWSDAGMRSNASYTSGGHCQTASFTWIVECLDDNTGRLLAPPRVIDLHRTPPIRCDAASNSSVWGHNVSCPGDALRCVARNISSPRNGFPWSCEVKSIASPTASTLCSTGAPFPLSTTKKNVLIIGDSVSNGYFMEGDSGTNVPDLLKDIALAQHAPFSPGSGGAGATSHGLDCLETYLQLATGDPAHYDAITFNFGLHDLGNKTSDVSTYVAQLSGIADRLVQTGSKLIYLATTPMMPECCNGAALLPSGEGAPVPKCKEGAAATYRCDGVVVRLNQAATAIMAARKIPIVDLHTVVTNVCAPNAPHQYINCSICRMEPCSYHYKPAGYAVISKPIAAAIRAVLLE